MGTSFERWEKDPFFPTAEAVQESADRMESVYRLWIQERRDGLKPDDELRRELHTVLGTAKWQLEELERAVTSNDNTSSAGEGTRVRHSQFVAAIEERIAVVESSLRGSNIAEGEPAMTWVRLDEGERDELALFLSGSKVSSASEFEEASSSCSRFSGHSRLSSSSKTKGSCASADTGVLKILVTSEESVDERPNRAPQVLSFPGLTSAVESATNMRWYRNGFRKWRSGYQHDAAELIPLHNHQLSRDIDACYDRSKSCLSNCDDSYEKQLNGWTGTIHRQLQRSQYQIQYGRPVQMIVWAIFTIILIVVFVLHAN